MNVEKRSPMNDARHQLSLSLAEALAALREVARRLEACDAAGVSARPSVAQEILNFIAQEIDEP